MTTTPSNAPLPEGHLLGDYRIVRKIASGGFSFVYLAQDEQGALVAIKEYLPANLARRAPGELAPRIEPEHLITYRNGLKCFFEEGRALARVQHPNVVRVLNFFRAHETVYMVMAYEEGRSLQQWILRTRKRTGGEVLPERAIRKVFMQLCNGLREVHANRLLHLDIKPANIYLRRDASPILLDFGAARQTLSAESLRLFPMFTPGFAAPEINQRGESLGPWSDIYGIGASLFACMLGAPPPTPDRRAEQDKVAQALQSAAAQYSFGLITLAGECLALDPALRPPSVLAVQRQLADQALGARLTEVPVAQVIDAQSSPAGSGSAAPVGAAAQRLKDMTHWLRGLAGTRRPRRSGDA
ncbi:MAG: serine/threonine-protein kinase [Burkholderiales bacterium]|jgi:serine/threonine protein kinase